MLLTCFAFDKILNAALFYLRSNHKRCSPPVLLLEELYNTPLSSLTASSPCCVLLSPPPFFLPATIRASPFSQSLHSLLLFIAETCRIFVTFSYWSQFELCLSCTITCLAVPCYHFPTSHNLSSSSVGLFAESEIIQRGSNLSFSLLNFSTKPVICSSNWNSSHSFLPTQICFYYSFSFSVNPCQPTNLIFSAKDLTFLRLQWKDRKSNLPPQIWPKGQQVARPNPFQRW